MAGAEVARVLREQFGDLPLGSPETVLEHNKEWARQVERYIELGFYKELGMSKEEYGNSLPRVAPQPEQYRGRFDIPVVVESRIPSAKQAELAGIDYFLKGFDIRDWQSDPRGYRTPKAPYITWMQDGRDYLRLSVANFRSSMAEDERGATEYDGIALVITHPEILGHHYMDLPGTSLESGDAASLRLLGGGPRLDCCRVDYAIPHFGSASCGR